MTAGFNSISLNESVYFEPGSMIVWQAMPVEASAQLYYVETSKTASIEVKSSQISNMAFKNFRFFISAFGRNMVASIRTSVLAFFPMPGVYKIVSSLNDRDGFTTSCTVNVVDRKLNKFYYLIVFLYLFKQKKFK